MPPVSIRQSIRKDIQLLPTKPKLWTSASLNVELWFSFTDSSSLIIVDSRLSEWKDKSGKNRHVVQATPSSRPIIDNGVQFNGISEQLTTASAFTLSNTVNTFVLVERNLNGSTGAAPYSFGAAALGAGIIYQNNAGIQPWNTLRPYNQTVGRIIISQASSLLHGFIDGGNVTQNFEIPSGSYTSTTFSIGRRQNANIFTSGTILDILVISGVLNTSDRQKLEGSLAFINNLQSVLPANHPYRNSPPLI